MKQAVIIGGGAWGTALACVAVRASWLTQIVVRSDETLTQINQEHENKTYLPGIRLPSGISATEDISVAQHAKLIILAIPTQYLRDVTEALAPHHQAGTPVLIAAKGVEITTGKLPYQLVTEYLPAADVGVLSGPTFASEVAQGLPAAATLAMSDLKRAQDLAAELAQDTFRPYPSDDVMGVEVGGAVKNVLAIACGIVAGKQWGDNARAALISRGIAEIRRLALTLGGKAETLAGLSGIGDIVLTCTSRQSRNFSLGEALGQGQNLEDLLKKRTVEGVHTAKALNKLAAKTNTEMPLSEAVYDILYNGADIDKTLTGLFQRPLPAREVG